MIKIMRQVSVDAVSNVLGIIDGVNPVGDISANFALMYEQGKNLSGDLQGIFLAEEERVRAAR